MKISEIPVEILEAVRQRLGADDENDTRFDEKIEKMSPIELMRKWSGWELGDESWAGMIIKNYLLLKEIENNKNCITCPACGHDWEEDVVV